MDETPWSIPDSPFRGGTAPNAFYPSPTHEEGLARLHFLAVRRQGVGLLVGPGGSGKTLLLEVFARQLREGKIPRRIGRLSDGPPQVAKLSLLDVEPNEMLAMLALGWGVAVDPAPSAAWLWRALGDRLAELRYQRIAAVALFDDVDRADARALAHVARLARFDAAPDARLTLVLAGRNEGMARLDDALLDLVDLRIELEPWRREDTQQYVAAMLARGGRETASFDETAIDRLQELSRGIPRRAAQLADLALLAGAGQNLAHIDADVVEEVCQELGAGSHWP